LLRHTGEHEKNNLQTMSNIRVVRKH